MPIELLPVVYWITQDSAASYADTLAEIAMHLRPFAFRLIVRHAPPERSGLFADAVIYPALQALQHRILDQYLPEVEPNRVRSVACVWPWWQNTGMKVIAGGAVRDLRPLPAGNGDKHRLDETGWELKFYRNETVEQRYKWVHQHLENIVLEEKRRMPRDLRLDESRPPATGPAAKRGAFGDMGDYRAWLKITDPADWRDRLATGGATPRKRAQHARERLKAAYLILQLSITENYAKAYLERLKDADAARRRTLLNLFYERYLREKDASAG